MNYFNPNDTICAISTPIGEGGISIVRLSGPQAIEIAESICRINKASLSSIPTHTIRYGKIVYNNETIDEVLINVQRKPRSFTKEDIVEINTHGGIILTKKILDILIDKGARLALPGEFTKRAFLNGRIDLLQAEAVLSIIKSKTDLGTKTALQHLEGHFSFYVNKTKEQLIKLLSHIEAFINFPDEDTDIFSNIRLESEFEEILNSLSKIIATYKSGEVIREGVHTVLVGKTNVGKSSLLNTFLNRDRAIVSKYPGTTRDALEELIEIGGILFRVVDTAGIIPSPRHELDYLSVEKTRQHYAKGDLILFILDGSRPIDDEDRNIYNEIKDKKFIIVINKNDLTSCIDSNEVNEWCSDEQNILKISVVTKEGVSDLEKKMVQYVWGGSRSNNEIIITRVRHKKALEKSFRHIENAFDIFKKKGSVELLAYDIRDALDAIRELIGEVYSEDVLNLIFSEFCIGK